jgi:hypothetical protein
MVKFHVSRLLALATAIAICLGVSTTDAKEVEIDVKDLPQVVLDAVEATVPGGEIIEAEVETEKGKKVYEVEVRKDGAVTEIEIDETGKVLEVEKEDDGEDGDGDDEEEEDDDEEEEDDDDEDDDDGNDD